MDTKTKFINNVKCRLGGTLDKSQMDELDKVLHMQLDEYEIQNRCTDIVASDNNCLSALQQFIMTKTIEGLSATTIQRYYEENVSLLYGIGKQVDEITSFDIRTYLIKYKTTHDVSNRTLDGMRRCYSSFFSWCYTEEIINHNPCVAVQQIKYEKTIKTPFSSVELEKIKRACKTTRNRAIVELLYATGCRVSELSNMDRNDVDFLKHTAIVHGKGGKDRKVYITEVAMLYLTEYLEARTDPFPALFIGQNTTRLSKNGIEAVLRKIGKDSGVENVHPHRYRRTLATNLLDRGVPIQEVAEVLGHEDIGTTKIYCYISQQNVDAHYNTYIS